MSSNVILRLDCILIAASCCVNMLFNKGVLGITWVAMEGKKVVI